MIIAEAIRRSESPKWRRRRPWSGWWRTWRAVWRPRLRSSRPAPRNWARSGSRWGWPCRSGSRRRRSATNRRRWDEPGGGRWPSIYLRQQRRRRLAEAWLGLHGSLWCTRTAKAFFRVGSTLLGPTHTCAFNPKTWVQRTRVRYHWPLWFLRHLVTVATTKC